MVPDIRANTGLLEGRGPKKGCSGLVPRDLAETNAPRELTIKVVQKGRGRSLDFEQQFTIVDKVWE